MIGCGWGAGEDGWSGGRPLAWPHLMPDSMGRHFARGAAQHAIALCLYGCECVAVLLFVLPASQISILRNVTFLCPHVQSMECVLTLGPIGCWFSVFGRDGTALLSPPPAEPLLLTGEAAACGAGARGPEPWGVGAWGRWGMVAAGRPSHRVC